MRKVPDTFCLRFLLPCLKVSLRSWLARLSPPVRKVFLLSNQTLCRWLVTLIPCLKVSKVYLKYKVPVTLFESLPKVMVSQAEPACEESVSPVEPDALQMVGLQDPPDQAIGLVHNATDEALTANNLDQEKFGILTRKDTLSRHI